MKNSECIVSKDTAFRSKWAAIQAVSRLKPGKEMSETGLSWSRQRGGLVHWYSLHSSISNANIIPLSISIFYGYLFLHEYALPLDTEDLPPPL
jgi:hypothetical protein